VNLHEIITFIMNQSLSFRVFKAILALPVSVAIIIPSLLLYLSGWQLSNFILWRFLVGVVCFFVGLLLVVSTVRLFAKLGNGTLAPWDPTSKMVISGPYAYVRNPMIAGVVLILAGEALMLSSWAIGIWAVVFLIINMFYFPLSEEPGLRKRFGKEYEEYCKNVPRFIPRLTPWRP
jgi:protein-S-isoprenylcysteine O-methyltransferase Ste14